MKFIHSSYKALLLSLFIISFSYPMVLVEAATPTKVAVKSVASKRVKAQVMLPVDPSSYATGGPMRPVRLIVPSINMNAPIQSVGLNSKGEMAVPDGKSNNVGWYKDGTMPGSVGSAVLDAHVFAAFKALRNVDAGADVYVVMSDGSKLHFMVSSARNFATNSLSSSQLFRSTNSSDLNLITCSGSLTADHSTYDHRLIVYSTLVRE